MTNAENSPAATLKAACAALYAAKQALQDHTGPRTGPEWTRKTDAYRAASDQFDVVFNRTKGEV